MDRPGSRVSGSAIAVWSYVEARNLALAHDAVILRRVSEIIWPFCHRAQTGTSEAAPFTGQTHARTVEIEIDDPPR
jgi:hypothetical protein